MKIFLISILLITSGFSYAQDSITHKTDLLKKDLKVSYPAFIPHVGAGLASGLRLGIWAQINENLAAEVSGGYDLANFTSASDEEVRYGAGISYIIHKKVPLFINGLFTVGERTKGNLKSPKYYYSLNIGYMSLSRKDVFFFARGGVIFKYYYERAADKVQYDKTNFNLDIGVGYTF